MGNENKKKDMKTEAAKESYIGSVKFFKHLILSFAGIAIIAPTVILLVLTFSNDKPDEIPDRDMEIVNNTGGRGTVLTPDNLQQYLEERDKPVDDGSYTVSMTPDWTFNKWDTPSSDAWVENFIENTRTVYFDVWLDDASGEAIEDALIYSSPYLPVGTEIGNFALQKAVPAGRYTATVTFFLVDDDHNVITDVTVGIRLNINN